MILFATSPQDALNFCEETDTDFDSLKWYRDLAFIDPKELEGVEIDDISCTPAFRDSPAYVEVFKFTKTL